ncbi:hypothetical protein, partial [Neobacillus vireti]|uniref:hypothetical protein n=1 Tax=Neobacillus vireti TaxID=220686 RepID=UPI001955B778
NYTDLIIFCADFLHSSLFVLPFLGNCPLPIALIDLPVCFSLLPVYLADLPVTFLLLPVYPFQTALLAD